MALTKIDDRGLKTPIDLLDDEKIRFGTGNDLSIYHSGGNNYIDGNSTAEDPIFIRANVGADHSSNIHLQAKSGEDSLVCMDDEAVGLYYDGTQKFKTASYGAQVSGNLVVGTDAGELLFTNPDGFSPKLKENAGALEFYTNNVLAASWGTGGNLAFQDNKKVELGTGADLQIYHNGSHSFIANSTGQLQIKGDHIELLGNTAAEYLIRAIKDGAVELYYDNSKKLETNAQGIIVGGDVDNSTSTQGVALQTGGKIRSRVADASADAFIVSIEDSGASKVVINGAGNGYFVGGLDVPDSAKFQAGDGDDLQIYHDGSNSHVRHTGTGDLYIEGGAGNAADVRIDAQTHIYMHVNGNEAALQATQNGAVDLYYDGSKQIETVAGGLHFADSKHAEFGNSGDLKIYHDGTYNNINSTNGELHIKDTDGGYWIRCEVDGPVNLYHDGNLKFRTYGSGAMSYGHIRPDTDDSYDLGISGARWDDVYATNGTIQTSDRNNKNTIVDSDLGLSFVNKLKPVSYKFNNKTRTHYGLIAQDVETTLSDISKSTSGFAGFIKEDIPDQLYIKEDEIPEGKKVGDLKTAAYTTYGLRYNEFISPLIKAVQELSAEVETLKTEVAALKAK